MSERVRDDHGKYDEKVTEQDILKAFDYEQSATEPMLKASEIRDALATHFGISVSGETVRRRLEEMEAKDMVASKQFGARAVGWTALVGPELRTDVREEVEAARDSPREEYVSLDSV